MIDLHDTRQIKALLNSQGFKISKSLGQNFLTDRIILEKIADAASLDAHSSVLEIGPGLGSLTRLLAARSKQVVAVEIDRALSPILASTLADLPNVEVVFKDILEVDLKAFCASHFGDGHLCAVSNLPYYITTKATCALLFANLFSSIVLTIQKEAADKITARPGSREYCLLSAYVAYFGSAQRLFGVPVHAFFPQPGVLSETVRIDLSKRDFAEAEFFIDFAKASFANRRKTLANNLLAHYQPLLSKEELHGLLSLSDIEKDRRAEDIPTDRFHFLSNVLMGLMHSKGIE